MKNTINEILKERLEGENLSFLTKKLGLPKGLLFRLVKEGRSVNLSNVPALCKLCDYLGISLQSLLTGNPEPKLITSLSFSDDGKTYYVNISKK